MKKPIPTALTMVIAGLLFTQVLSLSADAQAQQTKAADASQVKDKVASLTKQPPKVRKLPSKFTAMDGAKKLKYSFAPKTKPGGKRVLVARAIEPTTDADLKAVKRVSPADCAKVTDLKTGPAWCKIESDSKKELKRRAKAARLASKTTKSTSSADSLVKFTSDENSGSEGPDQETGKANQSDVNALLDQIRTDLDELGASSESEDTEAYDNAREKSIANIEKAQSELEAVGDTESAAMLGKLKEELINSESLEDTEEFGEEGLEMDDEDYAEVESPSEP